MSDPTEPSSPTPEDRAKTACRAGHLGDVNAGWGPLKTSISQQIREAESAARQKALKEALYILEHDDYETQTVKLRRLIHD